MPFNGSHASYDPDGTVVINFVWLLSDIDIVLKSKGAVTYHRIALTDAERTEKVQKIFTVVKVVSVAMKVVAECVRSA